MKTRLKINKCFAPLLNNASRYLCIYGGAGSGKSVFAAQKVLIRTMNEPGHRFLITRKVSRTIRNSQFALLKDLIRQYEWSAYFTIHETEMKFTCVNGNEIISAGLDDPEKLKSITGITGIWREETTDFTKDDCDQLDLRLRGESNHYKQIIDTFNPIEEKHWLKSHYFDHPPTDCTVTHTTYKDNAFIDVTYKEVLESLKIKNPAYYEVYCLGKWGRLKEGLIFKAGFYHEWDSVSPYVIPNDARGIIYCDPNLSKKGEGDTTAIVKLLFSPSTQKRYIAAAVCRSFSNSNDLLDAILAMHDERIYGVGFDGHVSQESTWTNNVRNYIQLKGKPFVVIDYKRYRVDDLAKNAQWVWTDNGYLFPPGFKTTEDGERFTSQVFSFAGKKAANADDAPDALICAEQFLVERGLAQSGGGMYELLQSLK